MNFKRFWAVFLCRNREFLRDRSTLTWNLLFPISLIAGFAVAFSGPGLDLYKVGVLGGVGGHRCRRGCLGGDQRRLGHRRHVRHRHHRRHRRGRRLHPGHPDIQRRVFAIVAPDLEFGQVIRTQEFRQGPDEFDIIAVGVPGHSRSRSASRRVLGGSAGRRRPLLTRIAAGWKAMQRRLAAGPDNTKERREDLDFCPTGGNAGAWRGASPARPAHRRADRGPLMANSQTTPGVVAGRLPRET